MKKFSNQFRILDLSLRKFLSFTLAAFTAAVALTSSSKAYASLSSECNPPSAPQGVQISHGAHYISSWWYPPANDGGCPITSYEVTLQPGNITKTVAANAILAESFLGYSASTTYTVSVVACNSAGCGEAGTATLPGTSVGTPPSAPQNLLCDRQANYLSAWWGAPANPGSSPVMSYKVSLKQGGVVVDIETTTEHAFSFTTHWFPEFSQAVTYEICVVAMNAEGNSPETCIICPGSGQPPSAPLNLQTGSGDTWVSAWWSPPADPGSSPITSYEVTLTTTAGPQTHILTLPAPLAEAFSITLEFPCSPATISVKAVNAVGAGPAATVNITIPGLCPP